MVDAAEPQQQIASIPFIDAAIEDEDLFGSALSIAIHLFPDWKSLDPEKLVTSRCTEGITNKLVKIHNTATDQIILLRCYGHGTSVIIDRRKELLSLINLGRIKMAPPIYGRFRNGFCYGFVPGKVLTPEMLSDPHISKLIARKLARWHRIQMPTEAPDSPNKPNAWQTIRRWLEQVPAKYSNQAVNDKFQEHYDRLNVSRLYRELESLQMTIEQQTNSPVVFCHNDLLSANIIYQPSSSSLTEIDDEKDDWRDSSKLNISTEGLVECVAHGDEGDKEDVVFIDYEYGAYMNRSFDIGNHFNEYAGFDCDYSKYPDEKFQLEWLKVYLSEWNHGQHKPSDEDLKEIYREVNKFSLLSHFFWAVWALVQASVSDIDFDYLGYAILRFDEFDRRKEQFLAL